MLAAADVADFLLGHADRQSSSLDPLKLQKLCYYAQGLHLARYGEPLFMDRMEAWDRGPVIPSLHQRFLHHENSPIPPPSADKRPALSARHEVLLIEVYERFGDIDGLTLSRWTHDEAPWKAARSSGEPHAEMTMDSLSDHFKSAHSTPQPLPPPPPSEREVAKASRLLGERADMAGAIARGRADADKGRLQRW